MSTEAEPSGMQVQRTGLVSRALVLGAIACLVGAGLLLWSRQGEAVFGDMVIAALAWCF
jgi:hypothetical protein